MKIKIKPRVMTATSKEEVVKMIEKLAAGSSRYDIGNSYSPNGILKKDTNEVILYNLEKHNKKTKINKRKKAIVNEHGKSFKRDIIKRRHWVAHVYFIPKTLIEKSTQNKHNFELKLK